MEWLFGALAAIIVAGITAKSNADLMQKQQDYNTNMMNKQNEYNTPSAQVDRLKDAGINPGTLAMSSGSIANTSAPALPFNALPTDYSSAVAGLMSSLGSSKLQFSQARTEDLLREERYNNLKSQTGQYLANIQKLGVDTKAQQIANDYASAVNEVSLMKSKSEIGLNLRQQAVLGKQLKTMEYNLTEVLPQQVKESVSKTNLNVLEQDKVVAEIERIFYQNAESEANIDALAAAASQNRASAGLLSAETKTEEGKQGLLEAEKSLSESSKQDLDNQIQLFLDTYDAQVTEITSRAKVSKKQANWFIVNSILGAGQSAAIGAGAAGVAARTLKSLGTAAKIGF